MYLNYREFYQRCTILIGENDSKIMEALSLDKLEKVYMTHWLIALEGECNPTTNKYEWNVSVYPASVDSTFNWKVTAYKSDNFKCLHKAIDFSREVEQLCKNDLLKQLLQTNLNTVEEETLLEKKA